MSTTFSKTNLDDIFINSQVPDCWPKKQRITYNICYQVICGSENYVEQLQVSAYELVQKAVRCLDPNVSKFPVSKKFSNFKGKVTSIKRRGSDEVVQELYDESTLQNKEIVGFCCEKLGITPIIFDKIVSDCYDDTLGLKGKVNIINEMALEVFNYAEKHHTIPDSRKVFSYLCGNSNIFTDNSLYMCFVNLKERIRNASKMHSSIRKETIEKINMEDFDFPITAHEVYADDLMNERRECDIVIQQYKVKLNKLKANWERAEEENNNLKELLANENILHEELNSKNEDLVRKLRESRELCDMTSRELRDLIAKQSSFSTKEINRRMKRRDEQIAKLKGTSKEFKEKYSELLNDKEKLLQDVQEKDEEVTKLTNKLFNEMAEKRRFQKQKSYYVNKLSKLSDKQPVFFDYDSKIKDLQDTIVVLQNEKLEIEDNLESILEHELPELKNVDGSYKNNVRACFQDLVLSGVGIKETKNVIITVLKNMVNIDVDKNILPSTSFARSQYEEARLLAMGQAGSILIQDYDQSKRTLQSDGTSKFGHHYGTYDIATEDGVNMVLGMRPMATGDSQTQMDVLKQILEEIEKVCNGSETDMAKKIIVSVKNTMSDRHIVQKKFNLLLEKYRSDVLPEIIEGWTELSVEEQNNSKKLNEFFCGLHYVVGLADQAESCLKSYEKLVYADTLVGSLAHGGYSRGESGTLRLIRTLCKAVQERGCEKSGRMVDFVLALEEKGISKNPLIQFKGNRFNVLFYNAGVIYSLYEHCQGFFKEVLEENKLLGAVHHDLNEPIYLVGCRALGFINKFVTGPLWRLFVKVENVLLLNEYYQEMEKRFLELSKDASEFLKGNVIFFQDSSLISKDEVYKKLLQPSEEFDESTKQLLELLFASFSIITKRMLHDHLNDGKYDKPSSNLISEAKSVPNTNTYPESNFGFLDRLMREKPRCNDTTYEAIIMCRSNDMPRWRDSLNPAEKEKWMNWVKTCKKQHHTNFLQRRKEIRKLRNEKRLSKIENKKRKLLRAAEEKEDICQHVNAFGGLWKTVDEVKCNLEKIDEKKKTDALKYQLKFRKKILCNTFIDSDLYLFSKDKKKRCNAVLRKNLETIIQKVDLMTAAIAEENQDQDCDFVVSVPLQLPICKLNEEKDRLKLMLAKEELDCQAKNYSPVAKRKKIASEDAPGLVELPTVTCKEDLIGKRVSHLTTDEKNKPKWFNGTVLCQKPGSNSELVIRYDGYKTLYSFDFSELSNGLVELIAVEPEYALGKIIQQKFCDEDEVDSWWEQGRIIAIKDGFYTINYFTADVDDIDVENDTELDVYETLVIPLDVDYMNNEIRFL